ncbi:PTS glucitol/sorbitol transporter subunit IIA [Oceanobacillus jeddahense]|uniref:PTS glucitol/sorbitol transporter subunit IIA n=1 Tax=Oceanobacillus jeddahense TaxID=1462527 RepID=UPI00059603F0|nr:PTS glucitol/sorbitol transporter subunit IIA [Oceanobacillus jeddahense]
MEVIYQTVIKDTGTNANEFLEEKMVILFGEEAPDDLKDFCYIVNVSPVKGEIKAGQSIYINEEKFNITSVGTIVKQNLESLGHITIRFDGSEVPELSGTLYLESKNIPSLGTGTQIKIIAD